MTMPPAAGKRTRHTVVVVDDERGVRESLRATLAAEYTVHVASGGEEALATVRAHPVDVVTLDLRMPGQSGPEILEGIKTHDPDTEVIIISGYGPRDPTPGALGVFAYVCKPFDIERVRDLVRQAAARRGAVRELRRLRGDMLACVARALEAPLGRLLTPGGDGPGSAVSPLTSEQRDALDRICADPGRLVRCLEDVVLLTGLETREVEAASDAVQIGPVLQAVCERHRATAQAKGLALVVDSVPAATVETDPDLLDRLLDAVVRNAVSFTNRGGVTGRVGLGSDGRTVTVSIRDSGPGIPRARVAMAFAPWSGQGPGDVGLGLRLVEAIARRLGARVDIVGEPGAGTEARVTLRLRPARPARPQATVRAAAGAPIGA
jgi:signal transduction histidine kinase